MQRLKRVKVTYVVLRGENAERLKRVEVRKYST
jgi:hypothetical protein